MTTSTHAEAKVLDVITSRRSRRAYSATPVGSDVLTSLFEAARWAPSSMNEQPWLYLYATREQDELRGKILSALSESNLVWAGSAPLLIVSFAKLKHSRHDRPNRLAHYDLGAANALLSLQATDSGLNVHQMAGFDKERLIRNLNVPAADYDPVVIMAIGYPGDAEQLPDHLKLREQAPRLRYRQSEFVMNRAF